MSATTALSYNDDDKINISISMCIPKVLQTYPVIVKKFCYEQFGIDIHCDVVNKPNGFCKIFAYLYSPLDVDLTYIRRSLEAFLAIPDTTPLVDRISISIRIAKALPTDQVKVEEFCREQFGNRILVEVEHNPNGFCMIFIHILENEPHMICLDNIRLKLKELTAHV
jgi:hypothetical protein